MLARKEAKINQKELAEKLGIRQETISKWEKENYNITFKNLVKLAKVLNKPIEYFLSEDLKPLEKSEVYKVKELPEEEIIKLPILGAVPCSNPDTNIETYMLGEYEVKKSIIKGDPKNYFVLKAISDSMINAGIKEGDILIVKRQQTAEDGDIVIVWIEGEGVTCKRYRRQKNKEFLEPANPKYKTIEIKEKILY